MSSLRCTRETFRSVLEAKEEQDLRDYNNVLGKGELNRDSSAAFDILDCNRLPLLKTKISTPTVPSGAFERYRLCRDWGLEDPMMFPSNSTSQVIGSVAKTAFGGAYRALSIRQQTSRVTKTGKEMEDENEKLARVLQYMNDAKVIIDQSRLYFEAAVSFQELNMFERASFCYKKSTKRANAALVVDTYDLPQDEKYRRHVERMSKFQLPTFMAKRNELRNNLIFAEEERQRLRARESHFQLARIHLLTDLLDLPLAHTNIRMAFRCCSNPEEHQDMLLSMHELLKEFASLQRKEVSLVKQIERGTQGPIADAHLNVLLELEALYPDNPDVHEWLGYRYTERCELEAAKFHFKKLRDLLEPIPDMADTLLVWGGTFKIPVTSEGDPAQLAIEAEIKANICKTPVSVITLQGEVAQKAVATDTDKHIADMAEQLRRRRERHQPPQSVAQGLGASDSGIGAKNHAAVHQLNQNQLQQNHQQHHYQQGAQTKRPSFTAGAPDVSGIAMIGKSDPDQHSGPAKEEQRDLAWFGGKHTDCNTILYRAPLQGWNTLLPSSFAHKAATPARKR